MTEEALTFAQELVDSLDGTCLHEWDLNAGAAAACIIATHPDGRRYSINLDVYAIAPAEQTGEGPKR